MGFIVWGRSPECQYAPPESFWNECTLRCNLVHFETILRNVTVCALTSSRLDDFSDIVYCTDDNIFWGGGNFYPSNTLDRTLPLQLLWLSLPGSVSVTPLLLMTARIALVGRLDLVSPIFPEHDQELGVKENMRLYRSWNLESHENLEFHFLGLERHGI